VRRTVVVAVAMLAVIAPSSEAWAAAGDPDPSFGGGDGLVLSPIHRLWIMGGGAVDGRGRTYAVGCVLRPHSADPFVVRYTPTGEQDASFGGDGLKTYNLIDRNDCASGVAVDSRGRAVVVGSLGNRSAFVLRLREHGSRDASFGDNGLVAARLGVDANAGAVAIQADGKIVVTGGSDGGLTVLRFLVDGSPDTAFSGDGRASDTGIGFATPTAIAIADSGAIGVAGSRQAVPGDETQMVIARLTASGTFDTGFDGDGVVTSDPSPGEDRLGGLRFTSTGKMLVGGLVAPSPGDADVFLARYRKDGTLDPTFDTDGVRTIDMGGSEGIVTLAPNGSRTIAVGFSGSNVDLNLAVWSVAKDGSLDPTFGGGDGTVELDLGSSEEATDVSVQAGAATVIGFSSTVVGSRGVTTALVARYLLV
jgi:uncharacterized delta-60 repeat protein